MPEYRTRRPQLAKGTSLGQNPSRRGTERILDLSSHKKFWNHESKERNEELESKEEILEAKYKKMDLQETSNSLTHLNSNEQELVLKVLKRYEKAFQGTRRNWNGKPIQLK